MVTPYLELADGKVQVVSQYDHGPDSIIKNKIRNFVKAADPGFFQDGGVVVKMKRVQPTIAVNQQYEKAKDQVRNNSFHNSLQVRRMATKVWSPTNNSKIFIEKPTGGLNPLTPFGEGGTGPRPVGINHNLLEQQHPQAFYF